MKKRLLQKISSEEAATETVNDDQTNPFEIVTEIASAQADKASRKRTNKRTIADYSGSASKDFGISNESSAEIFKALTENSDASINASYTQPIVNGNFAQAIVQDNEDESVNKTKRVKLPKEHKHFKEPKPPKEPKLPKDPKELRDPRPRRITKAQLARSERDMILAALIEYGKEHGHYNVPVDAMYECVLPGMGPDGEDYMYTGPLGQWLLSEKTRLGKATAHLSRDRELFIQMAIEGKLDFSYKNRGVTEWNVNLAALKKYREEHGHCNIPSTHSYECVLPGLGEDGSDLHYKSTLGQWLLRQRQLKKMVAEGRAAKGGFTPEREALLQELVDEGALVWDVSHQNVAVKSRQINDYNWPRHFAALVKYGEEKGHCNIPRGHDFECTLPGMGPDGCDLLYTGKLARWLDTQRRLKRGTHGSERLTPEREALLQGLVDQGVLLWDQVPCRLKSNKMLQTTLPVQDVEEVAQETRDAVGGDNSGVEGQEEFVSVTRVDIQGEEIPETIDGQEEIVHGPALELSAEGNGMEIADIEAAVNETVQAQIQDI